MADGMLFQEDSLHLLGSIHHLELGVIVEQAIQHGHMNTIDRLINTDRMDRRPLLLASARDGRLKIVERLLQKGVDPDYREQDWGRSPISQAAEYDHPDVVRLLLNHNVDPNMRDINGSSDTQDNEGETALMWTGRCGCEEACRVLLEHGADPNLQAKYGQSALIWAARNGHEGTARVIIQHGADPNLRDQDGRHGLSFAAEAGHESIVRLLLETTLVDIDARGTNGRTALFWAAIKGHLKIIELLLHSGADCQIKDTANRTALEWAMEEDHEAVVRMLQQHAEK
jgi:ankyrin repeat protein